MTAQLRQENAQELKVFLNHIYELKKGVRRMALLTLKSKYMDFVMMRLDSQSIDYYVQPISNDRFNVFFGRKECVKMTKSIVVCPLKDLTPEQDFILGTLLGYDVCCQCERFLERKDS